jgi:hypothetical protein
MHDRYADGASPVTSAPVSTVFAYKCKCGLAFTFEIHHGQPPKSQQTGMCDEATVSGYQVGGNAPPP